MRYAISFYHTKSLQAYAKKYLKVLPKIVTTLVSTGSSGCSIASAMLCLSKRKLFHYYIPKGNEVRHMTPVINLEHQNVAIVDDFICTGSTVIRLLEVLKKQKPKTIYILTSSDIGELNLSQLKAVKNNFIYIEVEDEYCDIY